MTYFELQLHKSYLKNLAEIEEVLEKDRNKLLSKNHFFFETKDFIKFGESELQIRHSLVQDLEILNSK